MQIAIIVAAKRGGHIAGGLPEGSLIAESDIADFKSVSYTHLTLLTSDLV